MRILVTGGAGFIGSHIVDNLIEQKHEVVIIDNLITGQKNLINPQATFYNEDIINFEKVNEIIEKHKIETVCHQAAQLDVRKSVENPQFDAQVNIIGTINIFEASRKNGVKKVVFASSGGAIYGDTEIIPTPESSLEKPISPYGIAKLVMEKYAYYYKHTYGIDYTALRYSNVYGPRQNSHGEAGVIAIFTEKMLKNEQCYIYGDGENTRDFVYVQDVVNANLKAIFEGLSGEYNICTSKQSSINQIFDILSKLTNTKITKQFKDAKLGEQKHSCLSFEKISKEANWQPQTELEQGLVRTVGYFRTKF